VLLGDADQLAQRFSVEDLPVLRSATTSKETFCPYLDAHAGAFGRTDLHEDIPPSGWTKPNLFGR
jgi:hypothetical protein